MESRKVAAKTGKASTAGSSSDSLSRRERSLFVRNINYETTEEVLQSHFCELVGERKILSVSIDKQMANGEQVSLGCGSIEFDSVETATRVCRDLHKTVLDGRALLLQHCQGKNAEADSTTTLFVGNVRPSVREEDLRERFSPFGRVQHLTIPPVPLGNKRGFAFVEYATEDEAQNALRAMANTSMHGWPLVVERAKESKERKHGHLE
ncbi:uncharacterized protein LOC130139040 isoform X2 [Syzygium oleosum]|uniref:uncharacterized protein LOC130139040 isoform X2 n=1 Tax=Syzygium oleosum TaxID=219896 RepID=UPI0024B87935|nr:uncharacterized protein LOC130139040 isoform X2 [Syzygium oleosum]